MSSGGYTDSDPTSVITQTLDGLWVTQVTRASATDNSALSLNLFNTEISKTLDYESTTKIYKGRAAGFTVFGQQTGVALAYQIVIQLAEIAKLDTLVSLYLANATLCIRDSRGNKIYGRMLGLPIQDQNDFDTFSLNFHDESFDEEI